MLFTGLTLFFKKKINLWWSRNVYVNTDDNYEKLLIKK